LVKHHFERRNTTVTSQSPFIIGAFQTEREAKNAIDALRNVGFAHDQIGFALREGGTVTHPLLVDLMNLGVPQDQANYYDSEFKAGHPIVSVRADGRDQDVMDILRRNGGYTYDRQHDTSRQATAPDMTEQYGTEYETDEQQQLKLREERLQAEKERVQTGEAHLRKEVVEEQQSFNVPVTHEEIVIERHPGSRQVSDMPIGQDETIRVPVSEERVNITKQPVETGEVSIRKRAVQKEQPVSETVRREEVHLEREGNPDIHNNDDLKKQ
jgi:uncharacterized protein (TIGR02271 family)